MKIANGVHVIELKGNTGNIHPTLIWDEDEVILVDAGFPGQSREIQIEMEKAGIPFQKLNKIIITHQDYDHIGGLKELLEDNKIDVIAHHKEKPYIDGEKPLIKMTPERLAKMFEPLPAELRQEAEEKFLHSLSSTVHQAATDGEALPYCGGITVIHTPGHSPGHICLYLNRSKTLITGDALNVVDDQLVGPNPVHTANMELARKSISKLNNYDIKTVICYHGGIFEDNVNQRLLELAEG